MHRRFLGRSQGYKYANCSWGIMSSERNVLNYYYPSLLFCPSSAQHWQRRTYNVHMSFVFPTFDNNTSLVFWHLVFCVCLPQTNTALNIYNFLLQQIEFHPATRQWVGRGFTDRRWAAADVGQNRCHTQSSISALWAVHDPRKSFIEDMHSTLVAMNEYRLIDTLFHGQVHSFSTVLGESHTI